MSLKTRLALLAGVLFVAFSGGLLFLRNREQARAAGLQETTAIGIRSELQQWEGLANQPLRRFATDFAAWPDLIAQAAHPEPAWADANLRQNLSIYEAHALWIVDATGRVTYAAVNHSGPALPLPIDPKSIPEAPVFAETRDGVLQVWSVALGTGRPAPGMLVVARRWDDDFVRRLSRLSGRSIRLAPPQGREQPGQVPTFSISLPDAAGAPIRRLEIGLPDTGPALTRDLGAAYLFGLFALLLVSALWLALRRWVVTPIDRIRMSLAQGEPGPIQPLLQDRAEFGRVARLVETAFTQKAALESTIDRHRETEKALRESERAVRQALDERARIARDLHDGVIQSIYAAGLGLESAVAQLASDPERAAQRLGLCRENLNQVIREVRSFINRIDPDEAPVRAFIPELQELARTLQEMGPASIVLDVDAAAAARLDAAQEEHALHFARECISNAVRHGRARRVQVQLGAAAGGLLLRVRDDGSGFDPVRDRSRGSGLRNLEARAREMGGVLRIESRLNSGTEVSIELPADSCR